MRPRKSAPVEELEHVMFSRLRRPSARFLRIGGAALTCVGTAIAPGIASATDIKPFTTTIEPVKITGSVKEPKPHREIGIASFYRQSGKTASGAASQGGMTAAHRRLPFGSKVRVKDMKTGKEIVVVIIDRGPFTKGRVIDLSHRAAVELGITGRGIAKVELVAE